MKVPPPKASPAVPTDNPFETETPSGVFRVVQRTAWHTKVQWVVVGGFIVGLGSFVTYGLGKIDLVNNAMAQTEVRSTAASQAVTEVRVQVAALDAGTRASIERLERKIDANNERQELKIDKIQQTMELVLKEVRKK